MKKLVILASLSTGNGNVGATGLSAYQIWLMQPGNAGKTLVEFFDSLKGDKGDPGDSVFKTGQQYPGCVSVYRRNARSHRCFSL
jgi:hypothetical protein